MPTVWPQTIFSNTSHSSPTSIQHSNQIKFSLVPWIWSYFSQPLGLFPAIPSTQKALLPRLHIHLWEVLSAFKTQFKHYISQVPSLLSNINVCFPFQPQKILFTKIFVPCWLFCTFYYIYFSTLLIMLPDSKQFEGRNGLSSLHRSLQSLLMYLIDSKHIYWNKLDHSLPLGNFSHQLHNSKKEEEALHSYPAPSSQVGSLCLVFYSKEFCLEN